MTPDYDLSTLRPWQGELWMCLQVDAIRAEILADQAQCLASSRRLRPSLPSRAGHDRDLLRVSSSRLGGKSDAEVLSGLLSCVHVVSSWLH